VQRQVYDPVTHRIASWAYQLNGIVAEEVLTLVAIPLEEVKVSLIERHRGECVIHILAEWPDEKQRTAALGVYGAAGQAECADWIAANASRPRTLPQT
jgi:hypothetical protein